jgi:hypothetical protein
MNDDLLSAPRTETRAAGGLLLLPGLSAIGQTALAYARRGWYVGPVKPDKTPYTAHGFRDFTDDQRQVTAWWTRWPNAKIGVWLGPSRLAVLDVDPRNGGDRHNLDGFLSAKDFDTPAEWTLSGGEHYWYHCPDSAQIGTTTLGAGLDLLAGDHYAIVAPSAGYTWQPGYGVDDIPLRPLPDGIRFALPRTGTRRATAASGTPATPDTQAKFGAILGALGIAVAPGDGDVLVRCVFHADLAPSLHVDARRAIFHCFAPNCAAHPGGGLRKLAELAKTQHGIVLPSVTVTPAVLPWTVTDADRAACPDPLRRCAETWHDAHAAGAGVKVGFHHGSCHKRACPVWRKVRAGGLLRDVPTWAGIFAQTVTPATWRRLREAIGKRNGRYLHVKQADGTILAISDQGGAGWQAISLEALFLAVADSVGRIGRPHADRKTPDGAMAATEHPTASSFVGLDKHERIAVLALENEQVQPDERKAILRALRRKGIGPLEREEVRALWRKAGFRVDGASSVGSWDNARQLVRELQNWAAARARKGRASIAATSVSGIVSAIDDDGSQTGATGHPGGAVAVISDGGGVRQGALTP